MAAAWRARSALAPETQSKDFTTNDREQFMLRPLDRAMSALTAKERCTATHPRPAALHRTGHLPSRSLPANADTIRARNNYAVAGGLPAASLQTATRLASSGAPSSHGHRVLILPLPGSPR